VPDAAELRAALGRSRAALHRGAAVAAERHAQRLVSARERLGRAPLLTLERRRSLLETTYARLRALGPQATLERGYAIVRRGDHVVRSADEVTSGEELDVLVADGAFGATVR